ncbi:DUF6316 family protein [Thiohalophilus sp.]|uniref:DUF6316 family protein n=1 Tax=Thiohalophilus sp. TaxID=3028392 RepID=UPI002ACE5799|nr:DUF6316 family protein [Thiohalophilus sp.]MDZ7662134.1 DUF6316 family protein [Thiohalophilus sp.]
MQINESGTALAKTRIDDQGPSRNGESGPLPPRSRRFHFNGRHGFFCTRERITFGPYDTFREAEQNLKLYLRRCGIVHYEQESRIPR